MENKKFLYQTLSRVFIFMMLIAGCAGAENKAVVIDGYDLTKAERFGMPEKLIEISGIGFYNGKADTVYAIQDEDGKLFRLAWGNKKYYSSKFAKKGDYEDLAILNQAVFILESDGTIYRFPFAETANEEIGQVQEFKDLIPAGEYEGMYGDQATGKLYIICKKCEVDEAENSVTGYVINVLDSVYLSGNFKLNLKEATGIKSRVAKNFRPSAISKNPVTGYWYFISAVSRLMVVTDNNWIIKETARLNESKFNQPEGIAFDHEGNLYLSNEGDDFSDGNILKFVHRPQK